MRGGRDHITVIERSGHLLRGNQPGYMSHVGHQIRAHFIGDLELVQNQELSENKQGGSVRIKHAHFTCRIRA